MIITAKFAGKCTCGSTIKRGMSVEYSRTNRKVTGCPACLGSADKTAPDYSDIAYEDQCAAACGLDSMSDRFN